MIDESQMEDSARRKKNLIKYGCVAGVVVLVAAVIALFMLNRAFSGPYPGSQEVQILNLEAALLLYRVDHGRYPTTAEGLAALIHPPPDLDGDEVESYLESDEIPTNNWGKPFEYWSPGIYGEHDYEIISLGKDGKPGGDGYDADVKSWEIR